MTATLPAPPDSADAANSDRQLAKIARGGALNLVGGLTSGVSGFLLAVVVTHGWDPSTAGVLFSCTSLFLICSATGLLGTDTGLARFVLRYEAAGRGSDVSTVLRIALTPVVGFSVGLGLLMFVGAGPIAHLVGLPDRGENVLRVLAFALPMATLSDASLAATQAFGNMRPTVVVDRILRSGGQPVTIAVAGLFSVGLIGLSLAWAIPYALCAIISPTVLVRTVRKRRAGWVAGVDAHPPRAPAEIRREFWTYTWLRGIARLFQVGLQRADIILVAALRSPAEAALYTAATRFVILGQLGVTAIQQVLQPRLSEMLAHRDDPSSPPTIPRNDPTNRVFSTSTAWIIALSWPIYLVAAVAAPLYLRVFGHHYQDRGQAVVVLMALGMLLAMAVGPVDVILLMAGRSALSLLNNGLALAVDIGLDVVLIPKYGVTGAASAWAIALGVRNIVPFVQVRMTLGLNSISRAMGIAAGAAVACFAVPMLLLRLTVGLAVLPALATLLLCCVLYAAVLWHFREPLELQVLAQARRRGGRGAKAAAALVDPSAPTNPIPVLPQAKADQGPTAGWIHELDRAIGLDDLANWPKPAGRRGSSRRHRAAGRSGR